MTVQYSPTYAVHPMYRFLQPPPTQPSLRSCPSSILHPRPNARVSCTKNATLQAMQAMQAMQAIRTRMHMVLINDEPPRSQTFDILQNGTCVRRAEHPMILGRSSKHSIPPSIAAPPGELPPLTSGSSQDGHKLRSYIGLPASRDQRV